MFFLYFDFDWLLNKRIEDWIQSLFAIFDWLIGPLVHFPRNKSSVDLVLWKTTARETMRILNLAVKHRVVHETLVLYSYSFIENIQQFTFVSINQFHRLKISRNKLNLCFYTGTILNAQCMAIRSSEHQWSPLRYQQWVTWRLENLAYFWFMKLFKQYLREIGNLKIFTWARKHIWNQKTFPWDILKTFTDILCHAFPIPLVSFGCPILPMSLCREQRLYEIGGKGKSAVK